MKRALTIVLGAGLLGCSDEPSIVSSDMSSRDIRITVDVDGNEERTRVSGFFSSPTPKVRIVDGDTLVLVTDTTTRDIALDAGKFQLVLPPYGGTVLVRLSRPDGRGGDVSARAKVAPPFVVDVPTERRASARVTVTWGAGTDREFATTLSLTGPCIAPQSRTLDFDTGTYTLNAGELEKGGVAARCDVKATVVKKLGSAAQTASRTFAITP